MESVSRKTGIRALQFMDFLEILNDYREYVDFEGNINEVLVEKRETLKEEREKYGMKYIFLETFNQFYCPPFKKHFLKGKELNQVSEGEFYGAIEGYENFYNLKQLFKELILTVEDLRKSGDFPPKEICLFNRNTVPSYMFIDTKGFYYEESITLTFYDVDFSKVRLCICGNYFWANRKDKFSCSSICGNRVRQRKFLTDETKREEYRKKRLEYYHENKEDIKKRKKRKKERKNNGTL